MAEDCGVLFADAATVAHAGSDGLHLDAASHARLAGLVAGLVAGRVQGTRTPPTA